MNRTFISALFFLVPMLAILSCGKSPHINDSVVEPSASNADYPAIKSRQDDFYAKTNIYIFCMDPLSKGQCVTALDDMLSIVETSTIFPTKQFEAIFLRDHFSDVDLNGDIDIDYRASKQEIKDFLLRQ